MNISTHIVLIVANDEAFLHNIIVCATSMQLRWESDSFIQ